LGNVSWWRIPDAPAKTTPIIDFCFQSIAGSRHGDRSSGHAGDHEKIGLLNESMPAVRLVMIRFPRAIDPHRHLQRYCGSSRQTQEDSNAGPLHARIPANRFGLPGMQFYLPEWCLITCLPRQTILPLLAFAAPTAMNGLIDAVLFFCILSGSNS
jgi:hypothetical protein